VRKYCERKTYVDQKRLPRSLSQASRTSNQSLEGTSSSGKDGASSSSKLAEHTRSTLDEVKIDEFYVVVSERENIFHTFRPREVISFGNLLKEI
jgi:hypothetical protein